MSIYAQGQAYEATIALRRLAAYAFQRLTDRLGEVRFIQVGANDGTPERGDPLYPFVRSGKWKGLLVEPLVAPFQRLVGETYFGIRGLSFARVAVGKEDGEATFYECCEPYTPLSSFNRDTIMSVAADYAKRGKHLDIPEHIREVSIPVRTLESLCTAHQIGRIDALIIDTEGHDCVVAQSLDLDARKPGLVYFEHQHCPDEDTAALDDRLRTLGYDVAYDRQDALAALPEAVDSGFMAMAADLTRALSRLGHVKHSAAPPARAVPKPIAP